MEITYTWYVPDTLTKTDPAQQGPTVAPARDGLTNVVIGTSWAVKGVADDGTTETIASYTEFGEPDTSTFTTFDDVTEAMIQKWLWSAPDGVGRLSKADQEGQLAAKIKAKQSPAAPKTLNPNAGKPSGS